MACFIYHICLGWTDASVKALNSIEELEEERRLFYVACCCPKENLIITMPSYMASRDAFFAIPSRFINEI